MELAKINTTYFCGIDLHGRNMYVCIVDKEGTILFHRNLHNDFKLFKSSIQKFLPDISVGVESMYCYYWLADACRSESIPFYLGHAYYMKAIHGGKKKSDRIDSKTIADLMRCNHFPLAYPYPREMRGTRDLLRRRQRFARLRAECYAHIQIIFMQHAIPISPADVKDKRNRRNLIQLHNDPDVRMSIATNLDMIDFLDPIIKKLEQNIRVRAKQHDRTALNILLSVPGIGDMLSLVILYECHQIDRFPSPQKFSSYARLVKCKHTSNGKITKGGNPKIGNPYLKWAIGDIIVQAARTSPLIQKYYQNLQARFGKARAKSIIAHKFGVAIYYMLKNKQCFNEKRFVQASMN